MKLLGTIRGSDVFPGTVTHPDDWYSNIRKTVRVALQDDAGKFGFVLYPKRPGFEHDYVTILGGGVENGEILEDAVRREIREEIGCEVKDIQELGVIKEFAIDNTDKAAESYCYYARVSGEKGVPHYDDQEAAGKAQPVLLTKQEAEELFKNQILGFSKHRFQLLFQTF